MCLIAMLSMQMRGKAECIAMYGIIPGPLKPQELQTYLLALVDALIDFFEEGHTVHDASTGQDILVKGVLWCICCDSRGHRDRIRQCDAGEFCLVQSLCSSRAQQRLQALWMWLLYCASFPTLLTIHLSQNACLEPGLP